MSIDRTPTSSGFYVTEEAPIQADNPIPTPTAPAPDILRCAYMEIVVTDLERSRSFYVDVLGLTVTEEDEDAVYLRSLEEFIHHNLVLRKGPVAAVAAFSYRVRTPEDLDRAVAFWKDFSLSAPLTAFISLCGAVVGYLSRHKLEAMTARRKPRKAGGKTKIA